MRTGRRAHRGAQGAASIELDTSHGARRWATVTLTVLLLLATFAVAAFGRAPGRATVGRPRVQVHRGEATFTGKLCAIRPLTVVRAGIALRSHQRRLPGLSRWHLTLRRGRCVRYHWRVSPARLYPGGRWRARFAVETVADRAFTSDWSSFSVPHMLTGADVVSYAKRFTGVPYVYGGNGPSSFDCSGFTSYVYAHFGYQLARSSYAQMQQGTAVNGKLELGDLVFWEGGGHVGIYTGNDSFISATVHRGVWTYSFQVWSQTQSWAGARRILRRSPKLASAIAHAAAMLPRNGGPGDSAGPN